MVQWVFNYALIVFDFNLHKIFQLLLYLKMHQLYFRVNEMLNKNSYKAKEFYRDDSLFYLTI